MLLTRQNYKKEINQLIESSDTVDIAVAFFGRGAENLIIGKPEKYRIICNLMSGGTNPQVIREIIAAGISVRQNSFLHAKIICTPTFAIVGSANFSTNGLNIEDGEYSGWEEAGYLVTNAKDVSDLAVWFEEQWSAADPISEEDLRLAKENWDKRTRDRVQVARPSLANMRSAELRGQGILFTVYRNPPSPQAIEGLEAFKETLGILKNGKTDDDWNVFEGWNTLEKNHVIISARACGKKLIQDGFYEYISTETLDEASSNGYRDIQIVRKRKTLFGHPVTTKDLRTIVKRLQDSGAGKLKADEESKDVFLDSIAGGLGIDATGVGKID
jgi:hypothetical protein